jgi:eukaryotic-like serine/threonine-protein kinase
MSTFEERLRDSLSHAYDIERELSGGGMSRVFVATDRALGRRIVIKVLPPELTAGVNRERFRREIQVAAQLQHPHIVTLLSAGEDDDIVYYTMPFIEGESLRVAVEKSGAMSVKDVVRVLHDVVDALAYAHARGVIHRDIKPGNILRQGAHSLVTDFGVAKALNAAMPASGITSAGMAIGTPAYMAPEQLAGDPASDHRIDIYAVGLLAYELLTGESPFTGPSPQATMAAQLTRDPEPLYQLRSDVPPALSAIIMQCLAKAPDQRPPTAEALLTALDSITTSSGDVKTVAQKTLPAVENRRHRLIAGAGIGALVVASIVSLFAIRSSPKPNVSTVTQVPAAATAPAAMPSAKTPAAPISPARPLVLTHADSMSIAMAIQKRLAQEEAVKGKDQVALFADSLKTQVKRIFIDSMVRANLPRGVMMPMEIPVVQAPWGRRRVVITEPRERRSQGPLNAFGRSLTDAIRGSLSHENFSLVDQDSVRAVLEQTRSRPDVERILNPDVLIEPTFVGTGDSATVIVTLRDLKNPSGFGLRVASAKISQSNPDADLNRVVQLVVAQLHELSHAPTGYRAVRPPKPPSLPGGLNDR